MKPTIGLLLAIAAGALNGSFALPMKRTTKWAFENTWLVYSVAAMLIVNWGIAIATIPNLADVYSKAGVVAVLIPIVFGLIWGTSNVLFGAGLCLIGITLTYPISIGLSTALGSLIPMAMHPRLFTTEAGIVITLGVAVLVAGVIVCAVAGIDKEAQTKRQENPGPANPDRPARRKLVKGLVVVVLSGLCDPFLNFAFSFGERIKSEAIAAGAQTGAESDAIWALALTGSFIVNMIYCTGLLSKNTTWSRFHEKGTIHYWFLAGLMGVIWMISITLYGRGASLMGPLGGSVGWGVFYCSIILFSTLWGILSGEWREGKGRPLRTLYAGLILLILAIVILGYGNTLPTQ